MSPNAISPIVVIQRFEVANTATGKMGKKHRRNSDHTPPPRNCVAHHRDGMLTPLDRDTGLDPEEHKRQNQLGHPRKKMSTTSRHGLGRAGRWHPARGDGATHREPVGPKPGNNGANVRQPIAVSSTWGPTIAFGKDKKQRWTSRV